MPPTTNVSPMPEFPRIGATISVVDWARDLEALYQEESPRGSRARDRLDQLVIKELRRYKERSRAEHEYIVTKISCGEDPCIYLRVERYMLCPRSKSASSSRSGSSSSIASTASSASEALSTICRTSLLLVLGSPAADAVTRIKGWTDTNNERRGDLREIERETFTGPNRPVLLDLALIGRVTHEHSTEYRIFKHQCYWYANVVSKVLQKGRTTKQKQAEEDPETMEVYDEAGGTYKSIRVSEELPKHTDGIYEWFQKEKFVLMKESMEAGKNWNRMVLQAKNEPVERRLKEEAIAKLEERDRENEELRQQIATMKPASSS